MQIKTIGFIITACVFSVLFLTLGLENINRTPQEVYRVYLAGKSLGLIRSKDELESYIDEQQEELKKKYNVEKVYAPDDLDIQKEITYSRNILSKETIYEKIKDISPFTIKGYSVVIKGLTKKDNEGKEYKEKNKEIYILDKKIFSKAVETTIKSFISSDNYNAYLNDSQKEIENTGSIIENLYIENKITIKEKKIPSTETIYLTKEDLSKFLLFGTTQEQQKYTVKQGDTITDVAFNNKISNEEFLIANPNFKSENTLLYPGQEVTLGILKPQFDLIEEDHVIFDEEKGYETETRYDNTKMVGTTEVVQEGVKGKNRVTQKIQKVNGEIVNVVPVATEELEKPITEIVVKGGKQANYSGYGTAVATRGEWGWPATCSSVSSGFGYRWGVLHDGTDIAGCGYGSNIFAAQAGTVEVSGYKYDNGEYILINHHNGYYSMYAHLCTGCRYVKAGDQVSKGQIIGGMGRTGAATGVHLHFSIWSGYPYHGGRAYNAMSFY